MSSKNTAVRCHGIFVLERLAIEDVSYCREIVSTLANMVRSGSSPVASGPKSSAGGVPAGPASASAQPDVTSQEVKLAALRATSRIYESAKSLPPNFYRLLDFQDADLRNILIEGIKLQHAKFAGARFDDAILRACDFRYANFESARLNNITIEATTKLDHANVTRAKGHHLHLCDCSAKGSVFYRACLIGMSAHPGIGQTQTDSSGAKFTRANLSGGDLYRSIVTGANFRRTELIGTQVSLTEFFKKSAIWQQKPAEELTQEQFDKVVYFESQPPILSPQVRDRGTEDPMEAPTAGAIRMPESYWPQLD